MFHFFSNCHEQYIFLFIYSFRNINAFENENMISPCQCEQERGKFSFSKKCKDFPEILCLHTSFFLFYSFTTVNVSRYIKVNNSYAREKEGPTKVVFLSCNNFFFYSNGILP